MNINIDPMTSAIMVMAAVVAMLAILFFLISREEKSSKPLPKRA